MYFPRAMGVLRTLGRLSQLRRKKQGERHQTGKGLMKKTVSVHVRYKSLYISEATSAKHQREMTKFCVF